jgi:hypothetical protein
VGLFVTPWFLKFDPSTMIVTKMPLWVQLPNLPLHFWHILVIKDTRKALDKHVKANFEMVGLDLFTYN